MASIYKVLEKTSNVACKLQLPDSAGIHPAFHVYTAHQISLPTHVGPSSTKLPEEFEMQTKPRKVRKVQRMAADGTLPVLIKLCNLPESDSTSWEDFAIILTQLPDFHVKDKVQLTKGEDYGPSERGPMKNACTRSISPACATKKRRQEHNGLMAQIRVRLSLSGLCWSHCESHLGFHIIVWSEN